MRQVPDALATKLSAAADSFASSFDDIRMDDIAQASGIPRATLYYYFSSKEDVLAFLLARALDAFSADQRIAVDSRADTRAKLRELVRTQLRLLDARPATAQLLLANLGRAGKLPDIAARIQETFYSPMLQVLADGVACGEVRESDAITTAVAIFGGVMVVGFHALVQEGHLDPDLTADRVVRLYFDGLATIDRPSEA